MQVPDDPISLCPYDSEEQNKLLYCVIMSDQPENCTHGVEQDICRIIVIYRVVIRVAGGGAPRDISYLCVSRESPVRNNLSELGSMSFYTPGDVE